MPDSRDVRVQWTGGMAFQPFPLTLWSPRTVPRQLWSRGTRDIHPPTPLTRGLWLHSLSLPLRQIQELEQLGPYPKDFSKVNMVHERIMELDDKKPAAFRLQNPDTRWDDMAWIQPTRLYLAQMHEFSLMALHRPYIFHRKESRIEALRASVEMLELQRIFLESLPPEAWRKYVVHSIHGNG